MTVEHDYVVSGSSVMSLFNRNGFVFIELLLCKCKGDSNPVAGKNK